MITRSFEECLEEMREINESQQKAIESLRTYNKEEEIAKRDKIIHNLYRHSLHMMSDKELAAMEAFHTKHYDRCNNGNHYIYDMFSTGVGIIMKIICPVCGESENITDIDSW